MNRSLAHLRQEVAALVPGSTVRRARALYFRVANDAASVYDQLDRARYATVRARLLGNLAALEGVMATQSAAGWNTTPFDQQISDGHDSAAELLHLLASTEVASSPEFRNRGPEDWEEAFGDVLDELTAEPFASRRAELMTRLYIAAHRTVGNDAAETISSVRTSYICITLSAALALADEEW